jgi:hypothetical protein
MGHKYSVLCKKCNNNKSTYNLIKTIGIEKCTCQLSDCVCAYPISNGGHTIVPCKLCGLNICLKYDRCKCGFEKRCKYIIDIYDKKYKKLLNFKCVQPTVNYYFKKGIMNFEFYGCNECVEKEGLTDYMCYDSHGFTQISK